MNLVRLLACAAIFTSLAGCGSQGGRQPVTGAVSYQGKPLNGAMVAFIVADDSLGRPAGQVAGAVIKDGRFTIPAEQGLEPGVYRVSISAPGGPAVQTPEEKKAGASARATELLPEKYNQATTLTAEVKASGSNHFDFKLE